MQIRLLRSLPNAQSAQYRLLEKRPTARFVLSVALPFLSRLLLRSCFASSSLRALSEPLYLCDGFGVMPLTDSGALPFWTTFQACTQSTWLRLPERPETGVQAHSLCFILCCIVMGLCCLLKPWLTLMSFKGLRMQRGRPLRS